LDLNCVIVLVEVIWLSVYVEVADADLDTEKQRYRRREMSYCVTDRPTNATVNIV